MTPLAARSLAGLLEQETGQQLASGRQWRIETALQPVMRANNISSLDMLAGMASQPGSPLREDVVEALLNHETSFYRDLAVFKGLGDNALDVIAAARQATKRIRIWSAGCSTGQEAYSLAFLFSSQAPKWDDWTIDILGSDVSPQAIAQARGGVYSHFEVQRGLPIADLMARFEPEGDDWRIRSILKARTNFTVHNLLDPPPAGRFDIILCRNVLLYFSAKRRRCVLDRVAGAIAPDGMLILGAGETVLDQTDAFTPDPHLRGVYRPAGA
ncbi:MAG TPA: CheR family methyltransferase [Sphingomonas sp.]|nr:CheR family methyltransferase [Sphingomonas sp.]